MKDIVLQNQARLINLEDSLKEIKNLLPELNDIISESKHAISQKIKILKKYNTELETQDNSPRMTSVELKANTTSPDKEKQSEVQENNHVSSVQYLKSQNRQLQDIIERRTNEINAIKAQRSHEKSVLHTISEELKKSKECNQKLQEKISFYFEEKQTLLRAIETLKHQQIYPQSVRQQKNQKKLENAMIVHSDY